MHTRRGFTLVEILVALLILSIIGGGLVNMILSQTRFAEKQMSSRNARNVSRNAMNIMLTDLRMVQDNGGLIGASNDSVAVRVPVAFGLYCGRVSGINTLSLLPVDSAMTALGYYGGWASRDSTLETYAYNDANSVVPFSSLPAGIATTCTDTIAGPGISTVTFNGRTGKIVQTTDGPVGSPVPGWPVFVYQFVTYRFEASSAFPGRMGLFRKVKSGSNSAKIDEIIAPFDTSAKFRYYILNADTAQWAPPASDTASLNRVRGLQLYLAGASARTPQTSISATTAALVTGVFFKNRRDP